MEVNSCLEEGRDGREALGFWNTGDRGIDLWCWAQQQGKEKKKSGEGAMVGWLFGSNCRGEGACSWLGGQQGTVGVGGNRVAAARE